MIESVCQTQKLSVLPSFQKTPGYLQTLPKCSKNHSCCLCPPSDAELGEFIPWHNYFFFYLSERIRIVNNDDRTGANKKLVLHAYTLYLCNSKFVWYYWMEGNFASQAHCLTFSNSLERCDDCSQPVADLGEGSGGLFILLGEERQEYSWHNNPAGPRTQTSGPKVQRTDRFSRHVFTFASN